MPPLGELLRRFRFLGVPGAPAAAVPADRRALRAAEVSHVLAAVRDAEEDSAAIVARAEHDARDRLDRAGRRARSILARAEVAADAARAEATDARLAQAHQESLHILADARREVGRLEHANAARLDDAVEAVVDRVLHPDAATAATGSP